MKTVFDARVQQELQQRIANLNHDAPAQWGKMNVSQMLRHCTLWTEWVQGTGAYTSHTYKQDLLGKILGRWALRSNTKNDKPIGRNMPAGAFAIQEKINDLHAQKALWQQYLAGYTQFSNDRFIHDFFGKMTREQIGIFAYKHYDHHLRQFGV